MSRSQTATFLASRRRGWSRRFVRLPDTNGQCGTTTQEREAYWILGIADVGMGVAAKS